VSLIAAVVSYLHALAVVQAVGARPPVSYLIPFLADLVILGASAALLDAARRRERLSPLAVFSLLAGIGVTLAMNAAAGWHHGTAGALVAGWPAVAFILALEALAGMVRRGRGGVIPQPAPAAPGHCPHGVAGTQIDGAVALFEHSRDCTGEGLSISQVAASYGVDRNKLGQLVRAVPSDAPVPGSLAAASHPARAPASANGSHGA